jgi:hypothetical protein
LQEKIRLIIPPSLIGKEAEKLGFGVDHEYKKSP